MSLKKLQLDKKLVKKLKNLLKKYKEINDIIVFGSAVKGKDVPNDIDIAVIVDKKDIKIYDNIQDELNKKVHIEMVRSSSLLKSRLSLNLLIEGYSIDKEDYLPNILGLKPVKIFSYNLKGFNRSKKALFSMALTRTLPQINGKRIAPGAVIIPIAKSGYFNEFLDSWQIRYKTTEYTMF